MTDDRAQAQVGGTFHFGAFVIITLIVAIVWTNAATGIGQSTDLGANLAGVPLAMIFGTMLLVIVACTGLKHL